MVWLSSWPEAKSKVPSPRADFPLARGQGNPRAELPRPHRGSQRPAHGRELLGAPAAAGKPGRRRAEGTRGAGLGLPRMERGPGETGSRARSPGRRERGHLHFWVSGCITVILLRREGEGGGHSGGGQPGDREVGAWFARQA